jgi:hypothetical protein
MHPEVLDRELGRDQQDKQWLIRGEWDTMYCEYFSYNQVAQSNTLIGPYKKKNCRSTIYRLNYYKHKLAGIRNY